MRFVKGNKIVNMADVLDLDQTEEFEVDDDGDRKSRYLVELALTINY